MGVPSPGGPHVGRDGVPPPPPAPCHPPDPLRHSPGLGGSSLGPRCCRRGGGGRGAEPPPAPRCHSVSPWCGTGCPSPPEPGACGGFARQGCPQGQAGQRLSRHRRSWVSSDPGGGPQALLWGGGPLFGDTGGTTGHPGTELGKTSTAKGRAGGAQRWLVPGHQPAGHHASMGWGSRRWPPRLPQWPGDTRAAESPPSLCLPGCIFNPAAPAAADSPARRSRWPRD